MREKIKNRKGQSVLEAAIVISCIAAALIAMQIYLKRGAEGRLRALADDLGSQYDPKGTVNITETLSNYSSTTTTTVDDATADATTQTSTSSSSSTEGYTGTETLTAY